MPDTKEIVAAVESQQPSGNNTENTNDGSRDSSDAPVSQPAIRRRLPDERHSLTHHFCVGGQEGYVTVGLHEDGTPGEVFIRMAKEGSTVSGLMDSFATAISLSLQYGVPLRDLVHKFSHVRFEPSGFTGNQEIPIAKSTIDYIFRWLGSRFLSPEDKAMLGLIDRSALVADEDSSTPPALGGGSAPAALSSPAGQPAAALAPSPLPPTSPL